MMSIPPEAEEKLLKNISTGVRWGQIITPLVVASILGMAGTVWKLSQAQATTAAQVEAMRESAKEYDSKQTHVRDKSEAEMREQLKVLTEQGKMLSALEARMGDMVEAVKDLKTEVRRRR